MIESKLAIIQSNLQEAKHLLEKAKKLAIEQDIKYLVLKVQQVEKDFLLELNNWRNLRDQNFPLDEKDKQVQLDLYISHIRAIFPDLLHNVEDSEL